MKQAVDFKTESTAVSGYHLLIDAIQVQQDLPSQMNVQVLKWNLMKMLNF